MGIVGEQGEQDQEAEASKDDAEHVIQAVRRGLSWVFPSHAEKTTGMEAKLKVLLDCSPGARFELEYGRIHNGSRITAFFQDVTLPSAPLRHPSPGVFGRGI